MMQEIKFTFKSLQLLPNFNRDPKKYNTWKQKLGIIASPKSNNLGERIVADVGFLWERQTHLFVLFVFSPFFVSYNKLQLYN